MDGAKHDLSMHSTASPGRMSEQGTAGQIDVNWHQPTYALHMRGVLAQRYM